MRRCCVSVRQQAFLRLFGYNEVEVLDESLASLLTCTPAQLGRAIFICLHGQPSQVCRQVALQWAGRLVCALGAMLHVFVFVCMSVCARPARPGVESSRAAMGAGGGWSVPLVPCCTCVFVGCLLAKRECLLFGTTSLITPYRGRPAVAMSCFPFPLWERLALTAPCMRTHTPLTAGRQTQGRGDLPREPGDVGGGCWVYPRHGE